MGIFLDSLKTLSVLLILKLKDKNDINSYIPINNMNVIEKVVEDIIKTPLMDFIKKHSILDDNMHRSCEKHSIITAKLEIDEEIAKYKDEGNKFAMLNTDLSSAYSTVHHKLLLTKLEHLGVRGQSYKLFESYQNNY